MRRMQADDPAVDSSYGEDGVDVSLIRWMLSLTPAQRLEVLEDHVNDILTIRKLNAQTYGRTPLRPRPLESDHAVRIA